MSSKKIIIFLCMNKMYLILVKGYENANVQYIPQKMGKYEKIWVSMKDFKIGMGAKDMPDLILKEIKNQKIQQKQNILQKNKLKNIKWLKWNIIEGLII